MLDPVLSASLVAVLTSIAAVITAMAALVRSLRNTDAVADLKYQANGQQEVLIRKLVQDAFQEGHRAGYQEHKALFQPPPKIPEQ